MKNKLVLWSILIVPLLLNAVTLEEVVKEVLSNSPVLQERIKYFRSVKQDINIAEAGYYPKLDLVSNFGRERTNNKSTLYSNVDLNMREVSLVLTQNLFEGFGTDYGIQKQNARLKSAAYGVIEEADKASLNMIEAYLNLLKQKELLSLSETNVQTNKDIHGKIQERIDSGVGTSSEIQQSTSRLALSQSNYITQLNNYEDSITSFIKYYGKNIDPLDLENPQDAINLPKTKEEALQIAKETHPSLKVQKANIEVVRSNYGLSKTNNYPIVDFEVRQNWSNDVGGIDGKDDSTSAMIKLSWNLYNGGVDKHSEQKSVSEINQEIESYNDLVRRVNERLSLAWNAFSYIKKQIEFLEVHKKMSKQTLDSYLEEFDLGRRTLLDILDTEEELYSANRELVNSKYDELLAQYRIFEGMGVLSDYLDGGFKDIVGVGDIKNSHANVLDTLPTL